MPTASGKVGPAQRDLSSVFVQIIPERPGQLLRQALQERFGDDSGTPAAYDLSVNFGITGDYDSTPDIDVLAGGIEDGMTQMLKVCDQPAR